MVSLALHPIDSHGTIQHMIRQVNVMNPVYNYMYILLVWFPWRTLTNPTGNRVQEVEGVMYMFYKLF